MLKLLYRIWALMPAWMRRFASVLIRPWHQVGVAAIILNEKGQILLCEHSYLRTTPWGLPGGDLKAGEEPCEGVRRELREETGMQVGSTELVYAMRLGVTRRVLLVYSCTSASGDFTPSGEILCTRYFDPTALPDMPLEQKVAIRESLDILDGRKRTCGMA
jgi:ADP-ribose pyrophosphatase YjhB (NUDIX family)